MEANKKKLSEPIFEVYARTGKTKTKMEKTIPNLVPHAKKEEGPPP